MKANIPWNRLQTTAAVVALYMLLSSSTEAAGMDMPNMPTKPIPPSHLNYDDFKSVFQDAKNKLENKFAVLKHKVTAACPDKDELDDFRVAPNFGASFTNTVIDNINTSTYFFSPPNTTVNPASGVPGLIEYCVYPVPPAEPNKVAAAAKGANGEAWVTKEDRTNFSFARPDGNPSNIPFLGQNITMGTATWDNFPKKQLILLHIKDPEVCTALYGKHMEHDKYGEYDKYGKKHKNKQIDNCFVKPQKTPVCDAGDTTFAYNPMPFNAVNCNNPSVGFEAQATNEFGDQVQLAGTARNLTTLEVLMASFACSVSGHWNLGESFPCVTTPGATFTHPITANIYVPSNLTEPIATVTQNFTFPFRPSADPVNCPGASPSAEDNSSFFNPLADPTQVPNKCEVSIKTVITFDFSGLGIVLPDEVVWTVAYNTTHFGFAPIGEAADCFSTDPADPGCPYDSLNVGARSHINAPYVGIDVIEDQVFHSTGNNPVVPLHVQTGFTGFRPEGAIRTAP